VWRGGETVGGYGDETVRSYFVVKGRKERKREIKKERKGRALLGVDAGALFVWVDGRGWKGG
jgi:hypothetical protein